MSIHLNSTSSLAAQARLLRRQSQPDVLAFVDDAEPRNANGAVQGSRFVPVQSEGKGQVGGEQGALLNVDHGLVAKQTRRTSTHQSEVRSG